MSVLVKQDNDISLWNLSLECFDKEIIIAILISSKGQDFVDVDMCRYILVSFSYIYFLFTKLSNQLTKIHCYVKIPALKIKVPKVCEVNMKGFPKKLFRDC